MIIQKLQVQLSQFDLVLKEKEILEGHLKNTDKLGDEITTVAINNIHSSLSLGSEMKHIDDKLKELDEKLGKLRELNHLKPKRRHLRN